MSDQALSPLLRSLDDLQAVFRARGLTLRTLPPDGFVVIAMRGEHVRSVSIRWVAAGTVELHAGLPFTAIAERAAELALAICRANLAVPFPGFRMMLPNDSFPTINVSYSIVLPRDHDDALSLRALDIAYECCLAAIEGQGVELAKIAGVTTSADKPH